jgi:hypothetical protein
VSGIKTRNSDMRSAAGSSACRFALSACIASKTGSLSKHANATLNFQREKIMTQIFDRTGGVARWRHLLNEFRHGNFEFLIFVKPLGRRSHLLMTRTEIVNHVY